MDLKDYSSDDEVFYGKLSLGEIKHMLISKQTHRQTIAANELAKEDKNNISLQLISTHSEPDITVGKNHKSPITVTKVNSNETLSATPNETDIFVTWDITSSDNSFLKLEEIIEESCGLSNNKSPTHHTLDAKKEMLMNVLDESVQIFSNHDLETVEMYCEKDIIENDKDVIGICNPFKNKEMIINNIHLPGETPVKQKKDVKEVFSTPSSVLKLVPSTSRTPANPSIFKKPSTSSIKKTPCKNKAFKHIASPVAYYINNSPQIPLIQNVNPKKAICGLSSIPKLVKNTAVKPSNKENVILPPVAYKSAKKTTVIDVSNRLKMPESQWAKKLTKSLPKPAIIKHAHREKQFLNKPLLRKPEDSFADLSLHQADLSVCTKKAAF